MAEENPQNNVQPQPTSSDFKSITGNTKFTDNTDALKKKVDSTKITKQEPCPKKDNSLQWESKSKGMKTSGDGFSLTEYNPPKLTKKSGPNGGPAVGTPTTNTPYRDIRCGNLLDKPIEFKCSLVSNIKLQSCIFQFEAQIENYIDEQLKIAWSYISSLFPSADYIIKMANTLCRVLNEFQRVMCLIQQIMECILSTIEFITGLISWALSLPMQFLAQLISCITSFLGGITGGMSGLMAALEMAVSSIFECKSIECKSVSSVYDIGDTASASGSDFSKIDDIWSEKSSPTKRT